MDQERQIRFLYPPIIVISFFLWRFLANTDGYCSFLHAIESLKSLNAIGSSLTIILAGTSMILVCGFLLGTFTFTLMKFGALLCLIVKYYFEDPKTLTSPRDFSASHEFPLREETRRNIWDQVFSHKPHTTHDPSLNLMASAWLDRNHSGEGITLWITRRWNAFNVSANICVGVSLAMYWFSGKSNYAEIPKNWTFAGWFLICAFALNGFLARLETMRMLRFLALDPLIKKHD